VKTYFSHHRWPTLLSVLVVAAFLVGGLGLLNPVSAVTSTYSCNTYYCYSAGSCTGDSVSYSGCSIQCYVTDPNTNQLVAGASTSCGGMKDPYAGMPNPYATPYIPPNTSGWGSPYCTPSNSAYVYPYTQPRFGCY
jgi:hypothetical protein